jgi:putative FmdB family regulatory protein
MPIYEYQCEACDHKMEKLQKLSDEPLKVCPICNELRLNKLVSAAGFRLKGEGWYETDFKTGKKKNVAGDNPNTTGSSESSGSDSSKPSTPAAAS